MKIATLQNFSFYIFLKIKLILDAHFLCVCVYPENTGTYLYIMKT